MNITKALADETRIRVLLALRGRELCVCQITELFQVAPSTMSKHLSILYQAGLVNSRKNGRWMHYSLPGADAPPEVQKALEWIGQSLSNHTMIVNDAAHLNEVLNWDPIELCRRQCRS